MAEEKACDRDGDHNDRTEGKYGIVCERRALAGILVLRPVGRRFFRDCPPHRSPSDSAQPQLRRPHLFSRCICGVHAGLLHPINRFGPCVAEFSL